MLMMTSATTLASRIIMSSHNTRTKRNSKFIVLGYMQCSFIYILFNQLLDCGHPHQLQHSPPMQSVNRLIRFSAHTSVGIVPVRLLPSTYSHCKLVNPNSVGIVPVRELSSTYSPCKLVINPNSVGIVPVREL